MSITSHTRHDTCPVWIVYHPEKIHTASLVCKTHKKWIQWLSRQDMRMLLDNDLHSLHDTGATLLDLLPNISKHIY